MQNKIKALKIELNDLDIEVKQSKYDKDTFETEQGDFLVLTDKEADERVKESIKDTLWAFILFCIVLSPYITIITYY